MTGTKPRRAKEPTHIRDVRGRKVTQLDPVELSLMRRYDVIDADALRPIVDEVGSGLETRTRRLMPVLLVGVPVVALFLIAQIVASWIQGDVRAILSPRNIALANIWFLILVIWTRAKRARFGRIRKIMLKHGRCPHCGYDLHGLEVDEHDDVTVCPECGCAWRIDLGHGS